jgi:hypothetical protein
MILLRNLSVVSDIVASHCGLAANILSQSNRKESHTSNNKSQKKRKILYIFRVSDD